MNIAIKEMTEETETVAAEEITVDQNLGREIAIEVSSSYLPPYKTTNKLLPSFRTKSLIVPSCKIRRHRYSVHANANAIESQ